MPDYGHDLAFGSFLTPANAPPQQPVALAQPGDLAAGNAAIDAAATDAGRSPTDVRRLLNVSGEFLPVGRGPLRGPAEQWAEELADLALSDGISVFVLGSDDPDDLRRFAGEVAPAVRELVAADRSPTAISGPDRPASTADRPASTPDRLASTPDTRPTTPDTVATRPLSGVDGPAAARSAPGLGVVPTPDDGDRRGTGPAWDESTRPTGPAPDPDRTYTAPEQATGQHLVDVHDALRAELAQLHSLVEQVAAGTLDAGGARSHVNTLALRQNKWVLGTYCESYCRIVTTHHTLEDRSVFPHLRRADGRLGPVLDRLEEEHRVIHDILERVDRALVHFVSVPDGTPELRAAVDLLSDALLSHLSYEERELVEPLARVGLY